MQDEKPSATAWRVAVGRAAHQYFDNPKVFDDPLALRIVGASAHGRTPEAFFGERYKRSIRTTFLRALVAVRSRIAEDALAEAVKRGVRQYVVLAPASTRSRTAIRMLTYECSRSIIRRHKPGNAGFSNGHACPRPNY